MSSFHAGFLGDGVCVVEWADKAAEIFPVESCWIDLDYGTEESSRSLSLRADPVSAGSDRYEPLIRRLKAAFLMATDAKSPSNLEGGE